MSREQEIAVLHEHHPARGGGERVAEALAETLDAPLYTAYATDEGRPSDLDIPFEELFGDAWWRPLLSRDYPYKYVVRDLIYMWAWEQPSPLQDYDVLVQSGNNPGWYVPRDDQTVIKYVHSTPRTAYDLFHEHGQSPIARLYSKATRTLYSQNLSYPDVYVANSDLVAARIQKYWGIPEADIEVVYPPVDTSQYDPRAGERGRYVTVSRLTEEKRIGTIIEAFQGTDYQLDVAGTGPREDDLREHAAGDENIMLHGYVSEAEKRRLLQEASGFVFIAENEDFGLVPVEAMAAGTPVIGVDDGFTRHQVQHGENGRLCAPNADSVEAAVRELDMDGVAWSPSELHAFARENFGQARWEREIQGVVETARDASAVDPEFTQPIPGETVELSASAATDGGDSA